MPAPWRANGSGEIVIVGGGIVGLAAAYKLALANPDARITVLEKEADVGRHQSGHNSGVLHAGLSYKPGSLKARCAVSGIRQMTAFCQEHDIPYEICGKLVVAADANEQRGLRELQERGRRNGLTGLKWLERGEMREIEPHVGGVAALRVPEEGIVDYPRVCAALRECIEALGGRVVTGAAVHMLRRTTPGWVAESTAGAFEATVLVNCAGLYADRVARLAGERPAVRILPFRGEYYRLRSDRESLVRHLIYPVPDPAFPFLGVHFTRMIRGGVEAGPNAVLAFAREGYTKADVNGRDLAEALSFPGLWHFLARHPRTSWSELRRSFSRRLFARALQRLVPDIGPDDLVPGGAGVRAQAVLPDGTLVQDFLLIERPAALHVLNAPSPAATASLAIGDEIARRCAAHAGVRS